jgi:hypothetical protein
MEQLNTLPYLEAVVRETLRLYSPVGATQRIAMHDAEIPLQQPFKDKHGVLQSTVRYEQSYEPICGVRWNWLTLCWYGRVSEGDLVTIPIRLLNRSTEIWGEDANEFKYAVVSFFSGHSV